MYTIAKCAAIVEVQYEGAGELHCCGQPMKLMVENTVDASHEKHVPVGDREGSILAVKVSSAPHSMTEEHYIEWIEVLVGNKTYREFLKPGQAPQVIFCIDPGNEPIVLREYCNLHGLWKG